MISFFEDIQNHHKDELPFVAYRKPNSSEVKALLQSNSELYKTEDFSESGFVFVPFDLESDEAILMPIQNSKELVFYYSVDELNTQNTNSFNDSLQANASQKNLHIQLVENGIKAINETELTKVVLSRCETKTFQEVNPIDVFQRLLKTYPNAFVYCWFHPKVGLWLGATPESLLKLNGKRLQTVALAGTISSDDDSLNWQSKEYEEQQIVTDYITERLKSSVSNVTVSNVNTVKAGNLLHLKTYISGIFHAEKTNLKELLYSLHPTPAVCGFPKNTSKQFILNNENYNRAYYTGFLGELNFKETRSRNTNRRNVENNAYASIKTVSDLYVNLRCMKISDNIAHIYVGGGITKDSIPESEWEETVKKAQTMKSVL